MVDDRPPRGRLVLALPFLVGVGAALATALLLVAPFDVSELLRRIIARLAEAGMVAPLLFVLVHVAAVVLLLPGAVFPVAAGFLFGVGTGALCSTLGKTLGALLAFLIGERLARGRLADYLRNHPKLARFDRRLASQGWRTVLLIRLVPVIPFKISNYVFGMSRFRFRDVAVGTLLGTLPFSLINAYLGSLAASLTDLTERPGPSTPAEWSAALFGLLVALFAGMFVVRAAQRALAASAPVDRAEMGGGGSVTPPP